MQTSLIEPEPASAPRSGNVRFEEAPSGVWILEDSPLEAEMARRALASRYDVVLFSDGSTVLERIANGSLPETLVLDWQLPTVSGLEVLRFLRATRDENTLPVLMLTAYGHKPDLIEGFAAGANDYLTKPYDVAELTARVGTLVRSSRLNQEQRNRTRQLAITAALGVALTQKGSAVEVMGKAACAISENLDADLAAVWTRDGTDFQLAAAEGRDAKHDLPKRVTGSSQAVGRIAAEGASWAIEHPARDERLAHDAWAHRSGAFAGYPLRVGDHVLGVMIVLGKKGTFAPGITELLASAADMLALGLERTRGENERAVLLERERAARSEAERANQTKDDFLATISHELRTPLNAISGWVQLLATRTLDAEKTSRALETISRNAKAQTQLIDDLLDVSRIISGKLRLDAVPIDLGSTMEMAVETVRPSADIKGVLLEVMIDGEAGTVIGDAARLQQVVWNLLANAVKFTPRGGYVVAHLRRSESQVEIVVEDSGRGIDPHFLPHVFDRFRQADGAITRSHGGLGLGLAIVRHLVELHGGTVEAESDGIGHGAKFIVRLPMDPLRHNRRMPSRRMTSLDVELECPAELDGLRVLVVDDDPDARDLLHAVLSRGKAKVVTASSASEALSLLGGATFDLMISDIGMPDEDGFSLIRSVRALASENGGRIPAIAVTAYAGVQDRTSAMKAGFNMHVTKPLDASELFVIIANLIGRLSRP